jgi:hypothetical protein
MLESRQEQMSRFCIRYNDLEKRIFHYYVESLACSTEMISILLRLECDINKLDAEGNSVLSQYISSFHFELRYDVFQLLHRHSGTEGIRWTDRKKRNLLYLLMRQYSDENVHILEDLLNFVDIRARDADGMHFEHHGAIYGAFTKSLAQFLQKRVCLNLHSKDFSGKTPLDYAEEEANRECHEGNRWQESLQNLRDVCKS